MEAQQPPAQDGTAWRVLAAVAGGLGVLGFVTFVGGALLWTRFREMGLPADHAVALVPKADLVATGAAFLAPALLLSGGVLLLIVIATATTRLPDWLRDNARAVAVLTALIAYLIVYAGGAFGGARLAAFALGALALSLGVWLMRHDRALPLFGLVAFVAIGTFTLAVNYERTVLALKVMPVAYVRQQPTKAPRVEYGYLVTETADRVYFSSLPSVKRRQINELREFPRSETDDVEVGELVSPHNARRVAALFAYNLCGRLNALRPINAQGHVGRPHRLCPTRTWDEFKREAGLAPKAAPRSRRAAPARRR